MCIRAHTCAPNANTFSLSPRTYPLTFFHSHTRAWPLCSHQVYRYNPDVEPPRLLAGEAGHEVVGDFKRGTVRELNAPAGVTRPSKL